MKIWIVGQYRGVSKNRIDVAWDFQGIFDNKGKAVSACKNKNYFIMPAILNKELPEKRIQAPKETHYPLHTE